MGCKLAMVYESLLSSFPKGCRAPPNLSCCGAGGLGSTYHLLLTGCLDVRAPRAVPNTNDKATTDLPLA